MVCVDVKLGCYKSYSAEDTLTSLEWLEFMFVSRDGKTAYDMRIEHVDTTDGYMRRIEADLEFRLKQENIIFLWDEGVKEKLRDIIKRRYG